MNRFLVALFICCLSRAAVIDWSTVPLEEGTWMTVGGVGVRVTVASYGRCTSSSSVGYWPSVGNDTLQLWMDTRTDNGSENGMFMVIDFDQTVEGVVFALGDVDAGEYMPDNERFVGWQDVVTVSAFQGASTVAISGTAWNVHPSFGVDADGNDYSNAGSMCLYGVTGNVGSYSERGCVTLSVDGPVNQLLLQYTPGGIGNDEDGSPWAGPNNPEGQRIVIGDVSFSQVPEPSTGMLLCVVGAIMTCSKRRYRKTH